MVGGRGLVDYTGQLLYQLNGRAYHTTTVVGDYLYLWAGYQSDFPHIDSEEKFKRVSSTVQLFSLVSGKWSTQPTTGTPPLGVSGYNCRAVADKLYYFGGYSHSGCYHNSMSQLDITNLIWTELAPTDPDRPVMRRAYGGMITIEWNGAYHLLLIGGVGAPPTTRLPHMGYWKLYDGIWRTNEHTLFNIQTGEEITSNNHTLCSFQ